MELAYLGLFSKVFNWVLDKIFEPIFKWLTGLLNTVFTWIFNEILSPVLLPILEEALGWFIELWLDIYSTFIYSLFAGVLRLIDYMEMAFDIFIGIQDVSYYPTSQPNPVIKDSLIQVLLQQKTVSTVFWMLTIAGLAIALMLTIFATAKSAFDLDFENKRPVSRVLTAMTKTFIQFLMVPLFVYFMLDLSAEILKIASDAITGDTPTTLGRIVFMVASLDAADPEKYGEYNISSKPSPTITLGTDKLDKARYPYYIKNAQNGVQPKDYADLSVVNADFDLSNFDYLIGFLAAIFLLFVMSICLITFVQRLFEIVLLYIVSPYFVSTMPLDDGERFGRWRDMFIGKCFTGFGSAIGMRLYLLVCQLIMGNTIRFSNSTAGSGSSIEMDYIMKLFFLIGGAWAVFKSGPMITQILSAGAGQQEMMTQSAAGGSLYGHTIGKAMSFGKSVLAAPFRGGSRDKPQAGRQAMNADSKQKFEGGKGDRMANNGVTNTSKAVDAWKKNVVSPTSQNQWKAGAKPEGARSNNITIGSNRSIGAAKETPEIQPGGLSVNATPNSAETAYKEKKNFRLGSMLQSTYDENGNHKIRVLGFGVDRDASGNTMAFKMPVAGLKVQRTDPDKSMKLAKMHIPGIARVDSNIQNGQLKYSDISVLHGAAKYHRDETGSNVRVLGGMTNIHRDQSGTNVDVLGGLTRVHHGESGTNVRVLGGMTQVDRSKEGTHVGVMGVHGQKFAEGGGSFETFGGHVSVKAKGGHVQSMKVGALEYSRSGVTKKVPQSAVSGSAPTGGSAPTPQPKVNLSVSQGSPVQSARNEQTSTNKPGSGTKPGGK